jgi:hypothetical protein
MSTAGGDTTMISRPSAPCRRAPPSRADVILHFLNSAISDEPPLDEPGMTVDRPEAPCTRPARGEK